MKKKKWKIIIIILLILILAVGGGTGIYLSDYYHADAAALEALAQDMGEIQILEKDHNYVFAPKEAVTGLIFYPGGKVQYESYAPLMKKCAKKGILCILVHMPGNLAVFRPDAARGLREEYPQIEKWYIGGHSLGGVMAASYASEHLEEYCGLVLLASYSTSDISESGLQVVSIYGSEDRVLNRESYDKNRENLPSDVEEVVIDGGSHAYFGCYGLQDGDGIATITNEEQMEQTADILEDFMLGRFYDFK